MRENCFDDFLLHHHRRVDQKIHFNSKRFRSRSRFVSIFALDTADTV